MLDFFINQKSFDPNGKAYKLLIMSQEVFDPNKKTYELLVKEYEIGATRYENIYKAIWLNFSYMSFLSAGILTFLSQNGFQIRYIIIIAFIPLLFWYFATYIPMDFYGKSTAIRLSKIEKYLNPITEIEMSQYTDFIKNYELKETTNSDSNALEEHSTTTDNQAPDSKALEKHSTTTDNQAPDSSKRNKYKKKKQLYGLYSVSNSVTFFGVILIITIAIIFYINPENKGDLNRKTDTIEIKKINEKLNKIDNKIDSIMKSKVTDSISKSLLKNQSKN